MSRLREIMLQRPREAAAVHPLEMSRKARELKVATGKSCVSAASPRQSSPRIVCLSLTQDEPPTAPPEEEPERLPAPPAEPPPRCMKRSATAAASLASKSKDARSSNDNTPRAMRRGADKVPVYLRRRQAQATEEQRLAALPKRPQAPPGYRLVEEDERLGGLEALAQQRRIAQAAVNSLPFVIETMAQRRREKDASERLAHIEKLEAMYSKKEVYVPEDSEALGVMAPTRSTRHASSPASPTSAVPISTSGCGDGGAQGGRGGRTSSTEQRILDGSPGQLPQLQVVRNPGKLTLGQNRSKLSLV